MLVSSSASSGSLSGRSSAARAVVACATFKGTLSSQAAGEAVARGLSAAGMQAQVVALADGGEGLVDALAAQVPGALTVGVPCRGPRADATRTAVFAVLPRAGRGARALAVIEMAASSGLQLVPRLQRDPKVTTSLGVGDQILGALEHQSGELEILLGLGGSATNDGGAGMAQALGARFLDAAGQPLPPGGAALLKLARIDVSQLDKRLGNVAVTVACDVRNPLTGPDGASHVFGAQKGGTPDDLKLLDEALGHYAAVIKRDLGKDVAGIPGAGAAGGLGAGCVAFLNATLTPGIELVLSVLGFDDMLEGVVVQTSGLHAAETAAPQRAALVVTGEGQLDAQTLMGKAPAGVAARAQRRGVRCVAIGGQIEAGRERELLAVFSRIESLSAFAGTPEAAMREPARWLENLAKARAGEWLSRP